jgi:glycosyltransferase involved in cell wall biosynthesis
VVGTVGRLVERKGHHDLLDAWPDVLAAHPNAELVLVGDGPERDALETHATRLGVTDSIHLLGRRDDVPELLALFDSFVFPSHYEGLPGALLEAMCSGLPIVTTPVDGCSELISHGEHGVHVPPHDAVALGRAVIELLHNPELPQRYGMKARQKAEDQFTVESMVEQTQQLYLDLLG